MFSHMSVILSMVPAWAGRNEASYFWPKGLIGKEGLQKEPTRKDWAGRTSQEGNLQKEQAMKNQTGGTSGKRLVRKKSPHPNNEQEC